jgi:hypothetical protein
LGAHVAKAAGERRLQCGKKKQGVDAPTACEVGHAYDVRVAKKLRHQRRVLLVVEPGRNRGAFAQVEAYGDGRKEAAAVAAHLGGKVGSSATGLDVGVRLRRGRGVGVVAVRLPGQDRKNATGPVYEGVRRSVARCFGDSGGQNAAYLPSHFMSCKPKAMSSVTVQRFFLPRVSSGCSVLPPYAP